MKWFQFTKYGQKKKSHIKLLNELYWFYKSNHMTNPPCIPMSEKNFVVRWKDAILLLGEKRPNPYRQKYQFAVAISKSLLVMFHFTLSSSRDTQFSALFSTSQVDSLTDKGKIDSQQDICHLHKLSSFFRCLCPVRPSLNLM